MAQTVRKGRVKEVPNTRHGRPAGVLIGFKSEDDWFDYRLENDPRFLRTPGNHVQHCCVTQWPSTKARRASAALLSVGWQLKRQSGSHRTLSLN